MGASNALYLIVSSINLISEDYFIQQKSGIDGAETWFLKKNQILNGFFMKRFMHFRIICIFMMLSVFTGNQWVMGQKNDQLGKTEEGQRSFEFTTDLRVFEYSMRGDSVCTKSIELAKYGYQFYVLPGTKKDPLSVDSGGLGEYYVIKFLNFEPRFEEVPVDSIRIDTLAKSIVANSKGDSIKTYSLVERRVPVTNPNGTRKMVTDTTRLSAALIRSFNFGIDQTGRTPGKSLYRKYFCLKASDLSEEAVRKKFHTGKPMLSVGALIVPLKIRFGLNRKDSIGTKVPMDFSTDFTLGPTVGIKWRFDPYQQYYFNVLGGIGVTTVAADSLSTRGVLQEDNLRLGAFTISYGILVEFNNFQIGAFVGHDYVGKAISIKGVSAWDYQGKPWLSVGLGYQIMSRNNEKGSK